MCVCSSVIVSGFRLFLLFSDWSESERIILVQIVMYSHWCVGREIPMGHAFIPKCKGASTTMTSFVRWIEAKSMN